MSEPTREQIKEAFNKTIERWEKIVEDVGYFMKSNCSLCGLFSGYVGSCDPDSCPIALYTKSHFCHSTPYCEFSGNRTPANALAELNFLRKVYIWWMEEGEKDKKWEGLTGYKKEEKKEEWVDVTENIEAKVFIHSDGTAVVRLYNGEYRFAYMRGRVSLCSEDKENYKIETSDYYFRILKKT